MQTKKYIRKHEKCFRHFISAFGTFSRLFCIDFHHFFGYRKWKHFFRGSKKKNEFLTLDLKKFSNPFFIDIFHKRPLFSLPWSFFYHCVKFSPFLAVFLRVLLLFIYSFSCLICKLEKSTWGANKRAWTITRLENLIAHVPKRTHFLPFLPCFCSFFLVSVLDFFQALQRDFFNTFFLLSFL